jgi:hypothetical protein
MSAARICERHGEWVDDGTTTECPECLAEIQASLDESVRVGDIQVVGVDEDGQTRYSLTADGEAHVQGLLDDALEQAAVILAQNLDVPRYIARDLLLHRAAELQELDR